MPHLKSSLALGLLALLMACQPGLEPMRQAAQTTSSAPPFGSRVMQDYLDFLDTEVDAQLAIQGSRIHTFTERGGTKNSRLEAYLYHPDGGNSCDGTFRIGSQTLTCHRGMFVDKTTGNSGGELFWGETPEFYIETAFSEAAMSQPLYVPRELTFTAPTTSQTIAPGTVFSWEPDPDFADGIIMILDYLPHYPENDHIETQYPDRIYRGKVIPDDGSYTITAEDLADFPTPVHTMIKVDFIRGSYDIVETAGGQVYALAAYSYYNFDMLRE